MLPVVPKSGSEIEPLTSNVPLEIVRRCYAESIRVVSDIRSDALVQAFATVPREHYLGPGPWLVPCMAPGKLRNPRILGGTDPRYLYHDLLVRMDPERNVNSGQPSAVAQWLDSLELVPGDHVFHVGCGLGYYTAVMADIVGPQGKVLAIDIDADFGGRARSNLSHLRQVEVVVGDGIAFDPGPVDAIFVSAGVTHPQVHWLDRLRDGGRVVLPLTATLNVPQMVAVGSVGQMLLIKKTAVGYAAHLISPVSIYPSQTGRDDNLNEDLRTALSKLYKDALQPGVQSLTRDPHAPSGACWLHGSDFCISTDPLP